MGEKSQIRTSIGSSYPVLRLSHTILGHLMSRGDSTVAYDHESGYERGSRVSRPLTFVERTRVSDSISFGVVFGNRLRTHTYTK